MINSVELHMEDTNKLFTIDMEMLFPMINKDLPSRRRVGPIRICIRIILTPMATNRPTIRVLLMLIKTDTSNKQGVIAKERQIDKVHKAKEASLLRKQDLNLANQEAKVAL